MAKLVIDIETVGENFDGLDLLTQEVLTRWIKKESANEAEYTVALEELKEGLGFSPLTGQIVVIGVFDYEKSRGTVYYQAPGEKKEETTQGGITFKPTTEPEMLANFWQGARHYQEFITFNGRAFDAPFIMIRSAIHGIRAAKNLMSNRYVGSQRFDAVQIDLADQLSFYGAVRRKGNLHLWCRAFGIKSPKEEGVSGEDVARLWRDRKFLEIAKYNAGDLVATAELYRHWERQLKF